MSDPNERDESSEFPESGFSLGGLGKDEFDSMLGDAEATPTAPEASDELELPNGALVAFRKSGGFRFSSSGVVVHRSGWVEPMEGTEGRRRHMNADAQAILERLLLTSGLTRVSHRKHKPNPDGYAYEIAAHVGGKLRRVELQDPIPDTQERLIRVLNKLLP